MSLISKKINGARWVIPAALCILLMGICLQAETINPSNAGLFSPVIWQNEQGPTLVYDSHFVTYPPMIGERECTMRILIAAKNLGWNVIPHEIASIVPMDKLQKGFGLTHRMFFIGEDKKVKLDYLKSDQFPKDLPVLLIRAFFDPEKFYQEASELRKVLQEELANAPFKGYLDCRLDPVELVVKQHNNQLGFVAPWYFSVPQIANSPNGFQKLMYCGAPWGTAKGDGKDNRRYGSEAQKYVTLFEQLDQQRYAAFYGPKTLWETFHNYQGFIPADGQSFVEAIHRHGMFLILHSKAHLATGTPTGRIFEGAAAAAIMICDRHPFVMREFGRTVLYIDESRDDLFEQVDAHVKWIRANPEKAAAMARAAHKIFQEKFTLEKLLAHVYEKLKETQGW